MAGAPRRKPSYELRDAARAVGFEPFLHWEVPGPARQDVVWIAHYTIGDYHIIVQTMRNGRWNAILGGVSVVGDIAKIIPFLQGKR